MAAVSEMMFASNLGIDLHLDANLDELNRILFSEEPGLLLQIPEQYYDELKNDLEKINFHKINPIGKINNNDELKIKSKNLEEKIKYDDLMKHWSKVSSEIKKLRDNPICAEEEEKSYLDRSNTICLLYTSPSPRDMSASRMPSSA